MPNQERMNWRSGKTLIEQLWFMYENQLGVDLKIAVVSDDKQKTYQCHKMIVRRLTSVFDLSLSEAGECFLSLDIGQLDPDIFSEILKFAYTDKLDVEDMKKVIAIHKIATLYGMDDIRKECNKLFLVKINKHTVWDLLNFKDEQPELEYCLGQFLAKSVNGCLNSPNFLTCDQKVLEFILDQEQLPVPEVKLIKSVIRWVKHKEPNLTPEKSRELLGPCLGKIRFLCLTASEFSEIVAPSCLLPQDDCLSILVNKISGKQSMSLPDYICKLDSSRDKPNEASVVVKGEPPQVIEEPPQVTEEPPQVKEEPPQAKEEPETPPVDPLVEELQKLKLVFPEYFTSGAISAQANQTHGIQKTEKTPSTNGKTDLFVHRSIDPKFQLSKFSLKAPGAIGVYIEASNQTYLKGIRITSRATPAGSAPGTYQEEMYVHIKTAADGKQAVYQYFNQKASHGPLKYFDVMFKNPCKLEKNTKYLINMGFRTPGEYLFKKRLSSIGINGYHVKITAVDSNVGADPIRAIFLED